MAVPPHQLHLGSLLLLGGALLCSSGLLPRLRPVPPSGPNFTLAVGSQCLTATAASERALLTLAPCATAGRQLQLWRTNSAGMLFMATSKALSPKPTWPGTLCAKPVGDCNRTTSCRAWLGDECVIPAHILAWNGSHVKLPTDCNQSAGHTCLGHSRSSVSLAPCSASASAGWVRKVPMGSSPSAATGTAGIASSGCGTINVMAAPYGAAGDGIHDDSAASRAAILTAAKQAIAAKCHPTVYFPAGVFILQNVELLPNVTLQGAGAGATVLRQKPGFGPSEFLVDRTGHAFGGVTILYNSYPSHDYNDNRPLSGIQLRDLTLDGNCWNQNLSHSSWNLYLNGVVAPLVENVISRNSLSHGFTLKESVRGVVRGSAAVSNGQNPTTLGDGFNLGARSTDNLVTHCNSSNNTGEGFEDEGRFGKYNPLNRNARNTWVNLRSEDNWGHNFLLLFSDHARLENSVSVNGGRSPTGVVDYYTAGVDICGTTNATVDGVQILNPANRGVWVRPERTADDLDWQSIGTNYNLTARRIEVSNPGTVAFEGEDMVGGMVDVYVRDAISRENTSGTKITCTVCLRNVSGVTISQSSGAIERPAVMMKTDDETLVRDPSSSKEMGQGRNRGASSPARCPTSGPGNKTLAQTSCPVGWSCELKTESSTGACHFEYPANVPPHRENCFGCRSSSSSGRAGANTACEPNLPTVPMSESMANVLIVGDSISHGYFPVLVEALNGTLAQLQHAPSNTGRCPQAHLPRTPTCTPVHTALASGLVLTLARLLLFLKGRWRLESTASTSPRCSAPQERCRSRGT